MKTIVIRRNRGQGFTIWNRSFGAEFFNRSHARSIGLAGIALLLLLPGVSRAEKEVGGVIASGHVEVGGREVWGDDDSAKIDEYRDLRQGIIGGGSLLLEDRDRAWFLRVIADDVGDDDQNYILEAGRYNWFGVNLEFGELPHTFSKNAMSPFFRNGSRLSLPSGFTRPPADMVSEVGTFAAPVDLGFRTLTGNAELWVKPTATLDVRSGYRIIDKKGTRPLSLTYGFSGFSIAAAPIKERIHEATIDVGYTQKNWNIGLSYTGNIFDNRYESITWDSPLNDTPAIGSSTTGNLSLAPDNSSHTASISAAGLIPASFPLRLSGTFSYGWRFQNEDFLPNSANPAVLAPELGVPAGDLDGEVHTMLGQIRLSGRPLDRLSVNASFRVYDHKDKTDTLSFMNYIPYDNTPNARTYNRRPLSYTRWNAGASGTYRVNKQIRTKLGFDWERWDRSSNREVDHTDEYGPELQLNIRPSNWAQIRATYEFKVKRGSSYGTFNALNSIRNMDDLVAGDYLGNQSPNLRKFDEADRLQNRFKLLMQLQPHELVDVTFTSGFLLREYDETDLGLTDHYQWNVGTDLGYAPNDCMRFSAYYNFDWIRYKQDQEQRSGGGASAGFWSSKSTDRAHNVGVRGDLVLIPDTLDLMLGYNLQRGTGETESTGFGAFDYPNHKNTYHTVNSVLGIHPHDDVTLRFGYRFEDYRQRDYKFDNLPLVAAGASNIYLGDELSNFDAHIFSATVIYEF